MQKGTNDASKLAEELGVNAISTYLLSRQLPGAILYTALLILQEGILRALNNKSSRADHVSSGRAPLPNLINQVLGFKGFHSDYIRRFAQG